MPPSGDITHWLRRLEENDRQAAQKLWEAYFTRLVGYARRRLSELPRRAADEEDVALSAFNSFCRGAERGLFPKLEDRDDLWQLLVMIARRKAIKLARHEGRDRRDWRRTQGEDAAGGEDEGAALRGLISGEPDPAFAAEVAEGCRHLLARLPDDEMRRIALCKMEGHTNEAIAAQLDLSLATVERRLALIRRAWSEEAGP